METTTTPGRSASFSPPPRELAARNSNGIFVRLLWQPHENMLTVSVEDVPAGDRFHLTVAPDLALDAFYHPFAHARLGRMVSPSVHPDLAA